LGETGVRRMELVGFISPYEALDRGEGFRNASARMVKAVTVTQNLPSNGAFTKENRIRGQQGDFTATVNTIPQECRVAPMRTDVSEVRIASIRTVTRIGELGTTLAVTSNRSTLRRKTLFLGRRLLSPS
jgi:hypothetical protein